MNKRKNFVRHLTMFLIGIEFTKDNLKYQYLFQIMGADVTL